MSKIKWYGFKKETYSNFWVLKVTSGKQFLPAIWTFTAMVFLNIPFNTDSQTQSRTVGLRKFDVIQANSPKPGDLHL